MSVTQLPLTSGSLQRFIETEDFTLLEKPIVFETTENYKSFLCCCGAVAGVLSFGIAALFTPISVFCPVTTYKHFGLRLDRDSVQVSTAVNDCCCHVASTQKTVPLEKIQDVELQENCVHTCFGLKQVNVQTAGSGSLVPEIAAAFLASPAEARQAIQIAVKLHKQAMSAPAQMSSMQRMAAAGPGTSTPSIISDNLMRRLNRMEQLVNRGVLTQDEFSRLKVSVLAAEQDHTHRLVEAADLTDKGLLTQQELQSLKSALITQITQ